MEKIDKIIKFIREDMMVAGNGGFTQDSSAEGPTAGVDAPLMGLRRRKDGNIDKRIKWMYKNWLNS
jgi:hypothetical protein